MKNPYLWNKSYYKLTEKTPLPDKKYKIDIIIGSNYGDEGKGLTTDYICMKSLEEGRNPIVVLNNGGAQRAHTVDLKSDGRKHVYRSLGSGTLRGVPTFLSKNFVVNPMEYIRERSEILTLTGLKPPKCYISTDAIMTTPYDMMVNQILMSNERVNNSCGMGVWETKIRCTTFAKENKPTTLYQFVCMNKYRRFEYMNEIRNYCLDRIFNLYSIKRSSTLDKFIQLIDSCTQRFVSEADLFRHIDFCIFDDHIIPGTDIDNDLVAIPSENDIKMQEHEMKINSIFGPSFWGYDHVIIENGQGLLLNNSELADNRFTTSSITGSEDLSKSLFDLVEWMVYLEHKDELNNNSVEFYNESAVKQIDSINIDYVTRSYITRHGDGYIENESDKINFFDSTNVQNKFQGNMRFGNLETTNLNSRIFDDFSNFRTVLVNGSEELKNYIESTYKKSLYGFISMTEDIVELLTRNLFITHMNEIELKPDQLFLLKQAYNDVYTSYTKYAEDIKCITH